MKTLFLGDVCATTKTEPLLAADQTAPLFGDIFPIFEGNDINMVNLECALTERTNDIKKIGPALKSPIQTAAHLARLGINYCGISNNHVLDFGMDGIYDTQKALKENGIGYTGFGDNEADARKDLLIRKDDETIAIIAVCEKEYTYAFEDHAGCRAYDAYDTLEDVRAAKAVADRVIVLYHGGKEHCEYPSPRLYKLCHAMAKAGADLILCQHSHCIGCYEEFQGCHILYGQGNFHFLRAKDAIPYESTYEMWTRSLAVHYDTKTNKIAFTPIVPDEDGSGVRLATPSECEEIMGGFAQRNEELQSGAWKDGWRAFCQRVSAGYQKVISREFTEERHFEVFAHYLDCQAHTDVWRELNQTYHRKK